MRPNYIRLKTREIRSTLPVPRPQCPICSTLERIQRNRFEDDGYFKRPSIVKIHRGGERGRCVKCGTIFKVETIKNSDPDGRNVRFDFRYEAETLNPLVKERLATYWMKSHKGRLPQILKIEVSK